MSKDLSEELSKDLPKNLSKDLSGDKDPHNEAIRNVAVIAHVDHGKTTLIDAILRDTGVFRSNQQVEERVLDSNDLERERGITILAKNTSIDYRGVKINIVDTPGHADFGGEVERTLSMVDGALLLVDACDGPMPQTRFVVQKALQHRLKIVLDINKIDRPDARLKEVYNEVFDLLVNLGADDEDVDFPIVYSDARKGFATRDLNEALEYSALRQKEKGGSILDDYAGARLKGNVFPVLDSILERVPPPSARIHDPLQVMVTTLTHDDYVGRIIIGRVEAGEIRKGAQVTLCRLDGSQVQKEVSGLWVFQGLKRKETEKVDAGDIAAVSGIEDAEIGETLADPENPIPLPPIKVEEPTVSVTFKVNDSPFAGEEGKYVTSRHLRDRLYREARKDVSLKVQDTEDPDTFKVSGRGELHLSILIETMRREGYEMSVSKPQVIFKDGKEPFEYLSMDVPEEYVGKVMEELGPRKAELLDMHPETTGRVRMNFSIPTRGVMGLRPTFLTLTKGMGIMHHVFDHYGPWAGDISTRRQGSMIAWEEGTVTAYALANAQERGFLFVSPGERVYAGQVVGENSRDRDMDINVCKKKHLTNMRQSVSEETVKLTPPRIMPLEEALQWINQDELLEVTPSSIRIRKKVLDRQERYRSQKNEDNAEEH